MKKLMLLKQRKKEISGELTPCSAMAYQKDIVQCEPILEGYSSKLLYCMQVGFIGPGINESAYVVICFVRL